MKREFCILATLVLAVSMISLVSAGVGYPYFENNTIVVAPGESMNLAFTLGNTDLEDKVFQASILEGSEIASFDKSKYTAETGTSESANLKIKVPSDAIDGSQYALRVAFSEGSASGMDSGIALGIATNIGFTVLVKKPEVESTAMTPQQMWMIAGAAIVILALIKPVITSTEGR